MIPTKKGLGYRAVPGYPLLQIPGLFLGYAADPLLKKEVFATET